MIDDFINRKHGKKKVAYDLARAEGNYWKKLTASSSIRNK